MTRQLQANKQPENGGCSCGHQTCMDFLDERAPNFRLPHHTERVGNRMCQKCLTYTKRLDNTSRSTSRQLLFSSLYMKLSGLRHATSSRMPSLCGPWTLLKTFRHRDNCFPLLYGHKCPWPTGMTCLPH
jgi:hypothetical protein